MDLLSSLLKWNDILSLDVKTEYLLEKTLPKNSITLLFGRGGIGKTSLCMQIAKAMAGGLPFDALCTRRIDFMGIYKKGNRYWMIKQYDGKRIERSLDTKVKRVAEERYAKIVAEIIDGEYFRKEVLKKPLKNMVARYENEYTNHKDYYQKTRDRSIFNRLYEYFGENATLKHVEDSVGGYE